MIGIQADERAGRRRTMALTVCALLWLWFAEDVGARAATGLGGQILGGALTPALRGLFVAFLVALGLRGLRWQGGTPGNWRDDLRLTHRGTAVREWSTGIAVSWASVLVCMLPLLMFRCFAVTFWVSWQAWVTCAFMVAGIALGTLAIEAVFRGYALPVLAKALGESTACFLLVLVYAAVWSGPGVVGFVVACLTATLFSAGWLRTHAVWLPWGLHLGWNLILGVLFGLPLAEGGDVSTVVLGQVARGGVVRFAPGGPSGMAWTALVLLASVALLVRLTRSYAWQYTHPIIVAGGYPVEVAPPQAHTALEAKAAAPPPLVQIAAAPGDPARGSIPGT